jgi:type II secretory pathway pseudopilin PulG
MSRRKPKCPPRDRAFTLIELLVVLVIVMVLAGLLSAAALKFLARMKRETAKVDIQNLTIALSAFYKDHHCYPPDREDVEDVRSGQKSAAMFFFPSDIADPGSYFHVGVLIDDNVGRASNELMVYYLGRQLPKKLNQFGPYMEFRDEHLRSTEKRDGFGEDDAYPEYLDPWGNPYVYIENYSDNHSGRAIEDPRFRRGHGAFEIISLGPDGKMDHDYWDQLENPIDRLDGDDDDIVSWGD